MGVARLQERAREPKGEEKCRGENGRVHYRVVEKAEKIECKSRQGCQGLSPRVRLVCHDKVPRWCQGLSPASTKTGLFGEKSSRANFSKSSLGVRG